MISTSSNFSTITHGKWILAGEHAVIRHCPALVFPVKNHTLKLEYTNTNEEPRAEFSGIYGEQLHVLFWGVLEFGMEMLGRSLAELTGRFHIENNIPVGAGMGVSAALCAALSRWFAWRDTDKKIDVYEFARRLENLFHGESSGVDITGASADQGMVFQRDAIAKPLQQNWQPHWYLSYSDQVGMTSHCVKKVRELFERDPQLAQRIDSDMRDSVDMAQRALRADAETGLSLLTSAINKAHICFSQWGLTGGKVETHINQLLQAGALAAKPTGSGDGGFILSLWSRPLTEDKKTGFIAV